ncbi:MAG: SRPBCC domain-containing protein [Bacteroidetes bacterium]|nr:SRPBCC domain-containing protein [Bacteroidota bacterium]
MIQDAFTIERIYNAPIEKVWKAITNKSEMKKWYFDLPEFKAEVGFEFQFTGGPDGGKQYLHLCKVTEAIPNEKLTYSWRYDGYPGNSFVTFELFADNGKTKLKLTHAGLDSFVPESNPDFAAKNFAEGWNHIIGKALNEYLELK